MAQDYHDLIVWQKFLGLAQGSLFELRTQLVVARKLGLVPVGFFANADHLSEEVSKNAENIH